MKDTTPFLITLETKIREASEHELFEWMAGSVHSFFATPDIPRHYELIKSVDISRCSQIMPRLMVAWMALLSGDHAHLFQLMESIHEDQMQTPQELSFFYALKALIGYMIDPGSGLAYAQKSLDILKSEPPSLFLANAHLTLGQLLTSNHRYREAAATFELSEKLFRSMDLPFPAAVALMNQMLNRYQLGEFPWIMERCQQVLLQSGSFRQEVHPYLKLIHLPLGMCYYQMNKPRAALRYLVSARDGIDAMDLFHLRGLAEQILFRVYDLLEDQQSMEVIFEEARQQMNQMHYEKYKGFLLYCGTVLAKEDDLMEIQSEVEQAELILQTQGVRCSPLILEALTHFTLMGYSKSVTANDLEEHLKYTRYIGRIPQTQQILVHLSVMAYQDGQTAQALRFQKEALQIFRDHGCCAAFAHMKPELLFLLHQLDDADFAVMNLPVVKPNREGSNLRNQLLTDREKEVVQLMSEGKSNAEISNILFIGIGTIKWHINHIFSKLEAKNRVQAIEKARRSGEI